MDASTAEKKRLTQDLSQAVSQLNNIRVEIAESKHEKDLLIKKTADFETETQVQSSRRKELESKIIVLENDLSLEKKKLETKEGLERQLLDLKTQVKEVEALGELKDQLKGLEEENERLKQVLKDLQEGQESLKTDNEVLKEETWNLSRKLEAANSALETERLRVLELLEDNQSMQSSMEKGKQARQCLIQDLEAKVKCLKEELTATRDSLAFKDQEFQVYKKKVIQASQELQEVSRLKSRMEELECSKQTLVAEVETTRKQLEEISFEKSQVSLDVKAVISQMKHQNESLELQIQSLDKECEAGKSLCRDLQFQVVSQRSQHDKTVELMTKDREETERRLKEEIESLNHKLLEQQSLVKSVTPTTESRTITNAVANAVTNAVINAITNLEPEVKQQTSSDRSTDDVESLLSTSLTKNGSSSASETDQLYSQVPHLTLNESSQGVILDQILNSKDGYIDPRKVLETEAELSEAKQALQEIEGHNNLLSEQNQVLKEEIRRLERTVDRMDTAKNMEYLKNLFLKYISMPEERPQLVPVFKTLLKLDKQEEQVFQDSQASWSSIIWGS